MWSLKTETVPVVIGAPGLVKKGVGQYLKKKKIIHSFKIIIVIIIKEFRPSTIYIIPFD